MSRWSERLKWLRRPNVGATGELKNLRVIDIGHPWIDRLSRLSGWLVMAFVVIVIFLPPLLVPKAPSKGNQGAIAVILVIYFFYVLLLETGSRALTRVYDLLPVRLFRICVNLSVASVLIYNSGRAESYLWCLYAVPLFQANMYLRRLNVVGVYVVTFVLYLVVSTSFFSGTTTHNAFGLLLTNTLALISMAVLLYWLFGAAREHRRREDQVRESLNKNIARLTLLDNVSSKMTYARNLEENLMDILEEALNAVSADSGSIVIVDPKTGELHIRALMIDKEPKDSRLHKRKDGIAAHVAVTGKPVNCTDTRNDPRYVESEDRLIRSILSVPINTYEKLRCVINADSPEPNHFKDDDITLFSSLGEHVSTMIESLLLREVVLSLSSLPLDKLHTEVVDSAFTLVRGDIATLSVVQPDGSIKRVATYPADLALDPPRNDSVTREILATGRPKIINDVQNDANVRADLKARGVASLIGVPLLATVADNEQKAIGTLFVFSKSEWKFGPDEIQILTSLAGQAASAIIQRRLHDAVASESDFQKKLLESTLDAIIAINDEGLVTAFNPQAEKILGYSKDEVLNTEVKKYYRYESDAQEVLHLLLDKKNKGRLINHYTYVKAQNGKFIPIRLSASLIDGGSVGFFRDDREDENMRAHLQHLSGLLKTGQAITEQNELSAKLQSVAEGTLETLHAGVVWIYYYNHENEDFQLPPVTAPKTDHDSAIDAAVVPFLTRVMNSSEMQFIENVEDDIDVPKAFTQILGIRSLAAGPLRVRDKTMGVMICAYRNAKRFDDEEQITTRFLIADAAWAIDQSEAITTLLDSLYKTNLNMTTQATHRARLRQILQHAASTTKAAYGALAIVRPTNTMQEFIQVGVTDEIEKQIPRPTTHGLLGRLLKPDEIINADNVRRVPGFTGFGPRKDIHPEITSFLGRAIMLNGKPIGNIYLGNKEGGLSFDDLDAKMLGIFATSVSVIIERELEHQAWRMKEAIALGTMLLAQLREAAKERWQPILSEIEGVGSGANRTPEENVNRLKAQIMEIDLALENLQLGIEKGPSEAVTLNTILYDIAERKNIPKDLLEINLPRACSVRGNKLLLDLACRIMVENAIIAVQKSFNNRPKRVVFSGRLSGGKLKGTIADSGDGIPEEIKQDLYNRPVKRQNGRRTYGSFIAGAIMHWHGGGVRIKDTGPEGTVIEFSLSESGE